MKLSMKSKKAIRKYVKSQGLSERTAARWINHPEKIRLADYLAISKTFDSQIIHDVGDVVTISDSTSKLIDVVFNLSTGNTELRHVLKQAAYILHIIEMEDVQTATQLRRELTRDSDHYDEIEKLSGDLLW